MGLGLGLTLIMAVGIALSVNFIHSIFILLFLGTFNSKR